MLRYSIYIMKRILIDARESGTSTGRYLDKLIEYLHKAKPDYDVVLLCKPHRVDYLKTIAPTYTIETTSYKEFSFGEQLGFWWQIRSFKPDLVFFPMVQQPILYTGRVVTTMQDLTTLRFRNPATNPLIFTIKRWVYWFVNWLAVRKSHLLLTPTEFVKQDIVKQLGANPDKITVTLEAADKITDAPEPFKPIQGKRFIMYVGRPLPHKNLNRLVDAFQLLHAEQPDLHLVLAGKTDTGYKQLKNYADHHGVRNVVFTDFVSEGQLRWLYEHASAYVFPSLSEGFGLPGLEAMQYDLPVVSSNATCLPEVYQDAAVYFNPHNSEDMADKIGLVLDDKQLAKELATKGRALVKTYSWERMAKQSLDVFRKSLGDS